MTTVQVEGERPPPARSGLVAARLNCSKTRRARGRSYIRFPFTRATLLKVILIGDCRDAVALVIPVIRMPRTTRH